MVQPEHPQKGWIIWVGNEHKNLLWKISETVPDNATLTDKWEGAYALSTVTNINDLG